MEKQFNVKYILSSKEFSEFYQVAVCFCEFIEKLEATEPVVFLSETRSHLIQLYEKGLALQWVNLQAVAEYEDKSDSESYEKTVIFISQRLGNKRYYWHVFDPAAASDKEPVCGDLADDLQDIYKDLKTSLMIFNLDIGDCKENALWQFKFDFEKHWSDHCIKALNAIHYFLQNDKTLY